MLQDGVDGRPGPSAMAVAASCVPVSARLNSRATAPTISNVSGMLATPGSAPISMASTAAGMYGSAATSSGSVAVETGSGRSGRCATWYFSNSLRGDLGQEVPGAVLVLLGQVLGDAQAPATADRRAGCRRRPASAPRRPCPRPASPGRRARRRWSPRTANIATLPVLNCVERLGEAVARRRPSGEYGTQVDHVLEGRDAPRGCRGWCVSVLSFLLPLVELAAHRDEAGVPVDQEQRHVVGADHGRCRRRRRWSASWRPPGSPPTSWARRRRRRRAGPCDRTGSPSPLWMPGIRYSLSPPNWPVATSK